VGEVGEEEVFYARVRDVAPAERRTVDLRRAAVVGPRGHVDDGKFRCARLASVVPAPTLRVLVRLANAARVVEPARDVDKLGVNGRRRDDAVQVAAPANRR